MGGRASKLLIGIVEDDPAVLHALAFVLQAEGYEVCPFRDPKDAAGCAEFLGADCVVLDYALPGTTGLELLGSLRSLGLDCPAIVIASSPSAQCRHDSRAMGAALIEKPLMGEDLSAGIHAALAAADN